MAPPPSPAGRRDGRASRVTAALGTLLVLAACGLFVAAGAQALNQRALRGAEVPREPVPTAARLMPLEPLSRVAIPRRFIGRVEAAQTQPLAFEQPGTLSAILVDEGDAVEAGQALARLDTRSLDARRAQLDASRDALEAQAELARLTAGRQSALQERGISPTQAADEARLRVAQLQAEIAEIDALLQGLEVDAEKSILHAPYAGRVGERFEGAGAALAPGVPVLSLLQNEAPLMRVGLPPEIAREVGIGDRLPVRIGDATLPAVVVRKRPDLDPATLTQAVILEIDAAAGEGVAIDGRTGTVDLPQVIEAEGAWVPLTALREGERGLWTVLAAGPGTGPGSAPGTGPGTGDEAATLGAVAVEILETDGERAFVSGAFPPGARIVVDGVHRVAPGQTVAAVGG